MHERDLSNLYSQNVTRQYPCKSVQVEHADCCLKLLTNSKTLWLRRIRASYCIKDTVSMKPTSVCESKLPISPLLLSGYLIMHLLKILDSLSPRYHDTNLEDSRPRVTQITNSMSKLSRLSRRTESRSAKGPGLILPYTLLFSYKLYLLLILSYQRLIIIGLCSKRSFLMYLNNTATPFATL